MEEKEFAKFKNITLGREYSRENINQLSDDLLKAYAEELHTTNKQQQIQPKILKQQRNQIPNDKFYRFEFDKLYLDAAIKSIQDEPINFLMLSFKKAFSYLLINTEYPSHLEETALE